MARDPLILALGGNGNRLLLLLLLLLLWLMVLLLDVVVAAAAADTVVDGDEVDGGERDRICGCRLRVSMKPS